MIKINLGSGPNGISGWDNLDWGVLAFLSKFRFLRSLLIKNKLLDANYDIDWPEIVLRDIRRKLPYKDNSVDYIYCSHVLEHFEEHETIKILKECWRILKNNGVVRIVLPDLKKLVSKYKDSDNFCNEFFGYSKKENYGLKRFFIRGHKWMYDQKRFEKLLKNIGFKNIKQLDFQKGACQDIDKLDYPNHQKISMYFECQKNF